MTPRRPLLAALVIAPFFLSRCGAHAQPDDADRLQGLTLQSLEASWVKLRFLADQAFEEAVVSRDSWLPAKPLAVRGTFDIGDRESGHRELIVDGVRTGRPARLP